MRCTSNCEETLSQPGFVAGRKPPLTNLSVFVNFLQGMLLKPGIWHGLYRGCSPLPRPPLYRQHLCSFFAAIRMDGNNLDTHIHARNLRRCRIKIFSRSLASCKLNRSGCSGPDSFNLRSRLPRQSPTVVRSRFHIAAGVSGLATANICLPASTIVGSSIAMPSRCRFSISR